MLYLVLVSSATKQTEIFLFFLEVRIQILSMARNKKKLSEKIMKNSYLGGPILIQLIRHLSC